jgi:7-cyano-7-deazaguanine synthase in queuosine biosynthesis
MKRALVVLDGTQESLILLHYAKNTFDDIHGIILTVENYDTESFEIARKLDNGLCSIIHTVYIDDLVVSTDLAGLVSAYELARSIKADVILIPHSVHTVDIDHHRFEENLESLEESFKLFNYSDVQFSAPLLHLDAAEILNLADSHKAVGNIINNAINCYAPAIKHRKFDWGKGCGECDDCKKRSKAWDEYIELLHKVKDI